MNYTLQIPQLKVLVVLRKNMLCDLDYEVVGYAVPLVSLQKCLYRFRAYDYDIKEIKFFKRNLQAFYLVDG